MTADTDWSRTGRAPAALRSLLRPDGSVIVLPAFAGELLRLAEIGLTVRVRADGGELSPAGRALLFDLHSANVRHLEQQAAAISARGSTGPAASSVELTTNQAAALLECSTRHARHLACTGRIAARRSGRDWLIDPVSLDSYRTGSAPP